MIDEHNTFMNRYAFVVEWFDKKAAVMRYYNLLFYFNDNTLMMVFNPFSS